MAPTSESRTPPIHIPSLWDLIDSLLKHPGLLFGASTLILGIFATKRIRHSIRRRHEHWDPLAFGSTAIDEKQDYNHSSLSDLPPPLRSVLTHDTLVEGLSSSQQQLIPSDPLPYQRQYIPSSEILLSPSPSRPWRRHSYPNPLNTDSPTTEIRSDETSYYPIIDDNGVRQPGRWRRRTLVFEMLPAATHVTDTTSHVTEVLHRETNGLDADISLKRDSAYAELTDDDSKRTRSGLKHGY